MPHPSQPPDRVLDLFAAEGVLERLEGGRGTSWRAGDLVLSPGHDESEAWLAPVQARLAVRLDEQSPRSVRLALPVPARDGNLTVDGWAATRFEAGTTPCRDLGVLRATAHLIHAHLASAVPTRPVELGTTTDQWTVAERQAYDADAALRAAADRPEPGLADLVVRLVAELEPADLGPEQLVHRDLAGNVLLDAAGVPFVIDLSPAWRSPSWAEAVCVLDAVLWLGAAPEALDDWRRGAQRQAMLRAALFRLLSDRPCDVERYAALGLV
ncbi:aminoglycoside phosphotransferase [Microbacterium sp. ARD31]|uniref:aminoglycoside phosphotransferase n=1 Tax=Microbacterium sp. ARD31 TaxID=2962576 RepID=UPI002881F675|nr:aminoglycoside phosphotransferase [Microbacterium sp. ARD31]MDT0187487.1 aminoglycoside phosphotransferase [Microbacterium sp. ARD31]